MPRFSVITPVLNGSEYIVGYVKTLQSQTFTDWEAIVVDDGSCDDSLDLIKLLTAADGRFRIHVNQLKKIIAGPYQARNLGLDLASGDFVCFLDVDDRWLPHKLESQERLLRLEPAIQLTFSAYIRKRKNSSFGRARYPGNILSAKQLIRFANPVPMLTSCVSLTALGDIRFRPIFHEDFIFWHDILSGLAPCQVLADPTVSAIYCVCDTSLSSDKTLAIIWILRCYRIMGYNRINSFLALVARGLYQSYLVVSELF